MVIKIDLHKNISENVDGITIQHSFDENLNTYFFENKFFARWQKDIKKRLISFGEVNFDECLFLLEKLKKDFEKTHTISYSDELIYYIRSKSLDSHTKEIHKPRVVFPEKSSSKTFDSQKLSILKTEGILKPRVSKTFDSENRGLSQTEGTLLPSEIFSGDMLLQTFDSKNNDALDIKVPEGVKLYDFQERAVQVTNTLGGRSLLALEPGLGKSATSLTFVNSVEDTLPVLIIVPASLKFNWVNEINKFSIHEKKTYVFGPKTKVEELTEAYNFYVINYDIVKKWKKELLAVPFKTVILDEAHYIKSTKAQRSKAVIEVCKPIKNRLALTGTPILNRPMEVFNIISFIDKGIFPNMWKFGLRYCSGFKSPWGWDFSGASHVEELNQILREKVMVRYMKKDVMSELPDKTRTIISLESGHKQDFKTIVQALKEQKKLKKLKSKTKDVGEKQALSDKLKAISGVLFDEMENLKQEAVRAKMPQALEFIDDIVDAGVKVIVFAHHKFVIDELMEHYGKIAVKIDGSMKAEDRQVSVDRFQNDDTIKVFVGSIKAAGVGITLTAASRVVFLEYDWTPAAHLQCEDRANRIGSKNNTNVYYLTLDGSIDSYIAKMIEKKQKVIDSILEPTDKVKNSNKNLFDELLSVLIKEKDGKKHKTNT